MEEREPERATTQSTAIYEDKDGMSSGTGNAQWDDVETRHEGCCNLSRMEGLEPDAATRESTALALVALEAHLGAEDSEVTACVNAEIYKNHSDDLHAIRTSSDLQTGRGPAHAVNGNELYAVLGVDQTATPAQIRSAFRKLSLAHHPDKGGDERMFEMILRAKEVLCDEHLRAVYDAGGLEALSRLEARAEKMELGAGHTTTAPGDDPDADEEDETDWVLLAPGRAVPVGSEVSFNMTTGQIFMKTKRPTERVFEESSGGACIL